MGVTDFIILLFFLLPKLFTHVCFKKKIWMLTVMVLFITNKTNVSLVSQRWCFMGLILLTGFLSVGRLDLYSMQKNIELK